MKADFDFQRFPVSVNIHVTVRLQTKKIHISLCHVLSGWSVKREKLRSRISLQT
jgi:hypothetical protein